MAQANHYCADCGWHFRVDPETHIDIEHDGGAARIVEDGNWRDWERRQQHREGLDIDER